MAKLIHRFVGSLLPMTSSTFDVLDPYVRKYCADKGLPYGQQKCILLVDCWWGWLDAGFRDWLHEEYPWVLQVVVPARCTPVAQPDDAGIIAMLKGKLTCV